MSTTAIQDELLSLPVGERLRMIDVLWGSLEGAEIQAREAAWTGESERRIDACESGALLARDAGEVFSDLRKRLTE